MPEEKDFSIPEFKSDIPEPLVVNLNPNDRFIMETLSVIKQQCEFIIPTLNDTRIQAYKTNGQVQASKKKIETLEAKAIEIEKVTENLSGLSMAAKLLSSRWGFWLFLTSGIFIFFVLYPYFLSIAFKDLLPALKIWFM